MNETDHPIVPHILFSRCAYILMMYVMNYIDLYSKNGKFKEAPYSNAYFWTFRQYIRINAYVIFFQLDIKIY